jgi:hypothetical protein
MVRVAEMVQMVSVGVLVAQLPLNDAGPLEVVDGLLVLAEKIVSVAEAVQSGGLSPAITYLSADSQRLPAVGECLLWFAEQDVVLSVTPVDRDGGGWRR